MRSPVNFPLSSSSVHVSVSFSPAYPANPANPSGTQLNSSVSKVKTQKSAPIQRSSSTRNLFDFAFTALTVPDLFTGGYSTFSPDTGMKAGGPGSQCVSPISAGPGGSPSISVLRDVTTDLTGVRCIPSTAPSASSRDKEDALVSVMVHTESLILALCFPSGRAKRPTSHFSFRKASVQANEVEVMYCDSVNSKSHLLSVDMTHWTNEGSGLSADTDSQDDLIREDGSTSGYSGPSPHRSLLAVLTHESLPTNRDNLSCALGNATYVLTQPHSIVAGVDSLGHIRMGLIPHSSLLLSATHELSTNLNRKPLCGTNAQMSAQCNSGTSKALALSSHRTTHSSSSSAPCSYTLAIGTTSVMMKVLSVVIVASPSTPSPVFHLSFLYKINTLFVPAFLLSLHLQPMTGADDNSPNMLVIGLKGDIGFLSGRKAVSQCDKSQSTLPTSIRQIIAHQEDDNHAVQSSGNTNFLSLHSALHSLSPCPPLLSHLNTPSSALHVAACSSARLTAVLQKGQLQLLHADSGLQVTSHP